MEFSHPLNFSDNTHEVDINVKEINKNTLRRNACKIIKMLRNILFEKNGKQNPFHGQSALRINDGNVDKRKTYQWLQRTGLRVETEALIMAAQEQSLFIGNYQKT